MRALAALWWGQSHVCVCGSLPISPPLGHRAVIHRTGPGKVQRLAGSTDALPRTAPLVAATRGYLLSLHGRTLAVHNVTGRLSAGVAGVGEGPRGVAAHSGWSEEVGSDTQRGSLAAAAAGRGPGAQVMVAVSDGRHIAVLDALLPYTVAVEEGTTWMRVPALLVGLIVAAFWFVRHRRQQQQQRMRQEGAMGADGFGEGLGAEGEEELARRLLRDMQTKRESHGMGTAGLAGAGSGGMRQRFAPRGTWAEPAFSSGVR